MIPAVINPEPLNQKASLILINSPVSSLFLIKAATSPKDQAIGKMENIKPRKNSHGSFNTIERL